MSNVPAFRLFPSEETRLRRENAELTRQLDDAYDQIHALQRELRAALANEKENA